MKAKLNMDEKTSKLYMTLTLSKRELSKYYLITGEQPNGLINIFILLKDVKPKKELLGTLTTEGYKKVN